MALGLALPEVTFPAQPTYYRLTPAVRLPVFSAPLPAGY
jgi:hypothetical protein